MPNWPKADRPFERLEENAGSVPEEEFILSDVARDGVGGVAGLLPNLERRDARTLAAILSVDVVVLIAPDKRGQGGTGLPTGPTSEWHACSYLHEI